MIQEFLKSAAVPGLLVVIGFYFAGLTRDPLRSRLQSAVWAVAFVLGAWLTLGKLEFPASDAATGLCWSALALVAFVWVSPKPVGSRYMLRALFVVGIGALVLWPLRHDLHGSVHLRNLLAFFFLGLGVWSILERSSQQVKILGLIALPLLSVVALLWLLVIKGGGSVLAPVSLVAALLSGVLAVALIAPQRVSAAGILPFVSVLVVALMAAGHFYLRINPWLMIYISVPFFVLWIRGWIPIVPAQPIGEAMMLLLIAVIPLLYVFWNSHISNLRLN